MEETWGGKNGYEPDFVERNGAFILSMLGIVMTCISGGMVYMLKSRCRTIRCCGVECERDVLDLNTVTDSNLLQSSDPGTESRV